MPDVVILTLREPVREPVRDTLREPVRDTLHDPTADGSGCGGSGCGCGAGDKPRVPVLACADALRAGGARVELVTACDESEIDTAVKPVEAGQASLVVAAATDAELRAVVRRLVRHYAPPPSKRPAELPPDRTVFDLPPLAILPLSPAVPGLVEAFGLPVDAYAVAAAALAGRTRRYDLLRNDAGSVTLHSALLGGVDAAGEVGLWHVRVEVDDAVLTDGSEPILACSVHNVGSSDVDGLPLVIDATADDGLVEVAVAVPVLKRRLLRETSVRFEVRRARGRAVSVTPRDARLYVVDDGVASVLTRKRSWWVERSAWAVYVM